MKTIHKLLFTTAPLALAMLLSANAEAATTFTTVPFTQQEVTLAGGGEDEGKTEAKAEKVKTANKPKKVKQRRVNHGPKKPIFPQTDRKKEKLNRARYLNAHR